MSLKTPKSNFSIIGLHNLVFHLLKLRDNYFQESFKARLHIPFLHAVSALHWILEVLTLVHLCLWKTTLLRRYESFPSETCPNESFPTKVSQSERFPTVKVSQDERFPNFSLPINSIFLICIIIFWESAQAKF